MATQADYDERAKHMAVFLKQYLREHQKEWATTEELVRDHSNPLWSFDPWARRHIHTPYQRRQVTRTSLDRAWFLGLVKCHLPYTGVAGAQRAWSMA